MSIDQNLAFEKPFLRSAAMAGNDPLDRISVRDYTLDVEIGAFQVERGVTQRIRVNVVLEVSRHAAAQSDDVDRVLSYDSITEAIDAQLSTERLNLLETFAERVAERVLADPRAVRAFVRVEKLDRIPGALGVEIVRSRIKGDNIVRPVPDVEPDLLEEVQPLVVFLSNAVLHSQDLGLWLDAIDSHALPAIICLEAVPQAAPVARVAAANRRIELLSIEQNAWVLAGRDNRCVVVDSRTELDWALKHHHLSVWAPSKIVLDAVDGPVVDHGRPVDLAGWLAQEFSAETLTVIGTGGDTEASAEGGKKAVRHITDPADL